MKGDWRKTKIVAVAITKKVGNTGERLTFTLPAPARHFNVLNLMSELGIKQDADTEQGFLTDTGEFVRRKPALMIAENAGQLKRKQGPGTYQGPELFSEDLW